MTFVFVLEEGEVIRRTLLFQAMFLLFSWHKWLFSSFWNQGKLSINLANKIHVFSVLLKYVIFFFVVEVEEVIYNTLPFKSMFLPFSWHKWLLFSFFKQGKFFITLCYFNPCFPHFLDINDFCFRTGSRGSYSSHFTISFLVSVIFLI